MDRPFTVILIRHLPTKGNISKRYIGWTDEPILENIQVKKGELGSGQVIGSDLIRCKQTAELLFENRPYLSTEKLRECSFGSWEQKTYEELKHEADYQAWLNDFYNSSPPHGESLQEVERRVMEGFYQAIKLSKPVIITHGGPMRILLTKFANVNKSFWDWEVPHGIAYTLNWKDKKSIMEGMRCTSYSVEHLMEKGPMLKN